MSDIRLTSGVEELEKENILSEEEYISNYTAIANNISRASGSFKYDPSKDEQVLPDSFWERLKVRILEDKYTICLYFYYVMFYLLSALFLLRLVKSFITLDYYLIAPSVNSYLLSVIIPIVAWLLQTNVTRFNYYNIKLATLWSVIVMLCIKMSLLFYLAAYTVFIPLVMKIRIEGNVTEGRVLLLTYVLLLVSFIVPFIFILSIFINWYRDGQRPTTIKEFKLRHYLDFYNGKFKYDMDVVNDMETGKVIKVKEKDRFLHTNIVGATGSGKTSSIILTAIFFDFAKRASIIKTLKKKVEKMLQKGDLYINQPFEDIDFSLDYFTPTSKVATKKLERLRNKYRILGTTVVAPECDLTDKVVELAKVFNLKFNRVDPLPDMETGYLKENAIGFNPLYMSPDIPEWRKEMVISKKASLLADVMQKLFERSGKSDPYFSSVNRIATTTLAFVITVVFGEKVPGVHPTIADVSRLLNDFSKIRRDTVKDINGKEVTINYYDTLKQLHSVGMAKENVIERVNYEAYIQTLDTHFTPSEDKFSASSKFAEHCAGLRVQFANLLSNPLLRNILCDQNSIDLDKILQNSEITVCNIELGELGISNSPAFGLLFCNSLIDAVLRRPGTEKTRTPHFWYVDEFPVVVSPAFESTFSLFRKFRVGMIVALQTLDQMQRDEFLKYLQGIMLNSCSHHAVFGRANTNDMKTFSDMAGVLRDEFHQKSYTESSLFNENPTYTESDRTTPEIRSRAEGSDVRFRDFQEITFFTTRDGRPLPPYVGKVHFLKPSSWKKRAVFSVDWDKYPCKVAEKASSIAPVLSAGDHQRALAKTTVEFSDSKTDGGIKFEDF